MRSAVIFATGNALARRTAEELRAIEKAARAGAKLKSKAAQKTAAPAPRTASSAASTVDPKPNERAWLEQLCAQFDQVTLLLDREDALLKSLADIAHMTVRVATLGQRGARVELERSGLVHLLDVRLAYPLDYADRMAAHFAALELDPVVLGLEGVMYSDFFDGEPTSRHLMPAWAASKAYRPVNQLGFHSITFRAEAADGAIRTLVQELGERCFALSEDEVDRAFALRLHELNVPRVCVPRKKNWVRAAGTLARAELDLRGPNEIRQILGFGGYANLELAAVEQSSRASLRLT